MKLWLVSLFDKFSHHVRAVLETIKKGFVFVGGAELTTEVPHGMVIIQGQVAHKGV